MVDEQRAAEILKLFTDLDVNTRLLALNKAQDLYKDMFNPSLSDKDWAIASKTVEHLYNIIREELRVSKQIRIKTDMGLNTSVSTEKVEKPKAVKKSKAPAVKSVGDFSSLMAEFAASVKPKA